MVILLLGVIHIIYIITIVYQQSREQKRVGGQLAPVSLSIGKYAVYSVICTKITIVNGALSWQNDEK